MKKLSFFLIICVLSIAPMLTMAEQFRQPHISVSGNAVKEFEPDIVRWQLSLRTEAKSSQAAASEHAEKLARVLSFLKEQAINEKDIETQHMSLSENWNYNNGKRFKQGYVAVGNIGFESTIKAYTELWTQIARFEGLSVHATSFDLKNRVEAQKAVRKQALLAAKEKAQSMAAVLDSRIDKVLLIEDLNWEDDVSIPLQSASMMRMAKTESMAADIVAPGRMELRSRVKVVFSLR